MEHYKPYRHLRKSCTENCSIFRQISLKTVAKKGKETRDSRVVDGSASLPGNISLREARIPVGSGRSRLERVSSCRLFARRCHRCLGQPYPPRTADLGGTSKRPNPVYQPTDPPSPPLVTYSVTADDQDDFDSLVSAREHQRCIIVMIRRV